MECNEHDAWLQLLRLQVHGWTVGRTFAKPAPARAARRVSLLSRLLGV